MDFMPRNADANSREKIDTIISIIQSWDTLPIDPAEFKDTQPFSGRAYLVKIYDQIKIRTHNIGDLNITFDDLNGRIGLDLNMLENRLSTFKEILDEVATDPSDDKAYVREEVARERGDQDLKEISGWDGPSRETSGFIWTKRIRNTYFTIAYFRDEITNEYVTRGLIVPFPPQPQWLIKDGRKYEWQVRPDDRARLFSEGFVDTDFGTGEIIDEDVSTPATMAVYLESTTS